MLEVFAYRKYKKYKLKKKLREANAKEALSKQDEEFIRHTIDNNNDTPSTQNLFKFLQRKKSSRNSSVIPPMTPEELIAIKSKDEGLSPGTGSGLMNRNCNTDFTRRRFESCFTIP